VDTLIGTTVDKKYEVQALLGAGGFGNVYQARQLQLERTVALKMMNETVPDDDTSRARFEREAIAVSGLKHRNIVLFYGYGTWNRAPYMVMELIRGESLDTLLRAGNPLPVELAISLVKQICEALACAHAHGVVHRDLKPSNIMLVKQDSGETIIKLIDFGLAKLLPGAALQSQKLTEVGIAVGSVLYMSPEQCRGKPADERSDIYAAGCILYQCLVGTPPFNADNSVAVMYQHLHQPASSLFETSSAELSEYPALELLLGRAMAKNPDDRFQTVEEMLAELAAIKILDPSTPAEQPATSKSSDGSAKAASSSRQSSRSTQSNADYPLKPAAQNAQKIPGKNSSQEADKRRKQDDRFLRRLPLPIMICGLIPVVAALLFFNYLPAKVLYTVPVTKESDLSIILFREFQHVYGHLANENDSRNAILLGRRLQAAAESDHLLGPTDHVTLFRELATLYFQSGDWQNTLECARLGLDIQERYHLKANGDTYMLADALERASDQGFHRKDTAEFCKRFLLAPENTRPAKTYQHLARVDMANLWLSMGDLAQAKSYLVDTEVPLLERAIRVHRLHALASVQLAAGNAAEALKLDQEALDISETNKYHESESVWFYPMALTYCKNGDYNQAQRSLKQLKRDDKYSNLAEAINLLICAHEKRWDDAKIALKHLLVTADSSLVNYLSCKYDIVLTEFARLAREAGQAELAASAELANNQRCQQCRALQ
jgi:serine/threonine protein kinase